MSFFGGSRAAVPPFYAMEAARLANARVRNGQDIVRFDVGQPDWPAPTAALTAASTAIESSLLGYTDSLGAPPLRAALSDLYRRRYGLEVDPGRIAITTGASGAFVLAFLAQFETGSRIAMAAPGYPPYRHILTALGMQPICLTGLQNESFQLTKKLVDTAKVTPSGIVTAGPANPTGACLSAAALQDLAEWVREHNATWISDEIYHGLEYDAPSICALSTHADAIVINSFSKFWGMTGWRVGWLVAPQTLMPAIERLAQNLFICPPAIAQAAAVGALQNEAECEARRSTYASNRALLLRELPKLGLPPVVPPGGAFYMLLDIARTGLAAPDFAARALEHGIALTPGQDFDEARGSAWVRLSYPMQTARVEEGLLRLSRMLG